MRPGPPVGMKGMGKGVQSPLDCRRSISENQILKISPILRQILMVQGKHTNSSSSRNTQEKTSHETLIAGSWHYRPVQCGKFKRWTCLFRNYNRRGVMSVRINTRTHKWQGSRVCYHPSLLCTVWISHHDRLLILFLKQCVPSYSLLSPYVWLPLLRFSMQSDLYVSPACSLSFTPCSGHLGTIMPKQCQRRPETKSIFSLHLGQTSPSLNIHKGNQSL